VPAAEWRRSDIDGLPVIANDQRHLFVAVMTGNYFTGVLGKKKPQPKNRKGSVTKLATIENGGQMDMFGHVPERQAVADFAGYTFWVLLIRTAEDAVYSELSCPLVYCDQEETVIDWSERLILPPIYPMAEDPTPDTRSDDDLDFDLTKKSA